MSKSGLQSINEQNRISVWIKQVEECRQSGLSASSWCRENGIAISTYFTRQKKVYEYYRGLQNKEAAFVEVPVIKESNATLVVKQGDIVIELNDASAIREVIMALKSC